MGLNYRNLDADTRPFIVAEVDLDIAAGTLYLSPWLSARGLQDYRTLLRAAAEQGSDDTLADELRLYGRINETAQRKKPKGGYTQYRIPDTAPETMSGEFTIFYVRGLCCRAIEMGITHLVIYRAKEVMNPRPDSEEMIGKHLAPQATLDDLRETHGTPAKLGFPPGPNSGLCCHLPEN